LLRDAVARVLEPVDKGGPAFLAVHWIARSIRRLRASWRAVRHARKPQRARETGSERDDANALHEHEAHAPDSSRSSQRSHSDTRGERERERERVGRPIHV
jgi:hypothetical protein